ncbi:hypothetical protein CALVIDRAFT_202486 [Calocera viscosa TUFC12733]|uniref:Uncharacterized protein n=1 Tax=Calocera viscosa (strain TUFC12733) TaxID=1330018 RepID=A0A167KAW9_CALVF|nr:hypothetical protein CALVIDRAFT_202486 [Calocera viscosa TUFC12733]
MDSHPIFTPRESRSNYPDQDRRASPDQDEAQTPSDRPTQGIHGMAPFTRVPAGHMPAQGVPWVPGMAEPPGGYGRLPGVLGTSPFVQVPRGHQTTQGFAGAPPIAQGPTRYRPPQGVHEIPAFGEPYVHVQGVYGSELPHAFQPRGPPPRGPRRILRTMAVDILKFEDHIPPDFRSREINEQNLDGWLAEAPMLRTGQRLSWRLRLLCVPGYA